MKYMHKIREGENNKGDSIFLCNMDSEDMEDSKYLQQNRHMEWEDNSEIIIFMYVPQFYCQTEDFRK